MRKLLSLVAETVSFIFPSETILDPRETTTFSVYISKSLIACKITDIRKCLRTVPDSDRQLIFFVPEDRLLIS